MPVKMLEGFVLSTISEPTELNFSPPRDEEAEPLYLGLRASTWGKIGVITALFAAVFWPNLRRLWQKTNPFTGEPNWGHSICVPIIGLYYLYVHREELHRASGKQFIWGSFARRGRLWAGLGMIAFAGLMFAAAGFSHGTVQGLASSAAQALGVLGVMVLLLDWGLAVSFFGLLVYVYGIYPGQNDYIKDLGMVITLFGIVLLMCGWDVMRIAWFPIAFLVCALPWPGLVYSWVAGPLQELAANVAVEVLKVTGVNAVRSGTKIIMNPMSPQSRMLNVAEACAGMRSLMTFIAVGAAVAFLSARPLWEKLIITASAVPIAIFCNVMRVSGQGLLDHYVNEKLSESFAHQFVGMIMLVPAFFLILGVGAVLDKIFLEEVDDDEREMPPVIAAPVLVKPSPVKAPATVATAAPAIAAAKKVVAPVAPKVAAIPARQTPAAAPLVSPPRVAPVRPKPAVGPTSAVPPRPAGLTPATRTTASPFGSSLNSRPPVRRPPVIPNPPAGKPDPRQLDRGQQEDS